MRTVVSRVLSRMPHSPLLSASLWATPASASLGVVNWIGYGPIYCAAANGYYKREGIDVRLVTFSDNFADGGALREGRSMRRPLTTTRSSRPDAKGWNLKVVMPLDYSVGGDAILASAAVRAVTDLKGRKVASSRCRVDFLLGYALLKRDVGKRCASRECHA